MIFLVSQIIQICFQIFHAYQIIFQAAVDAGGKGEIELSKMKTIFADEMACTLSHSVAQPEKIKIIILEGISNLSF